MLGVKYYQALSFKLIKQSINLEKGSNSFSVYPPSAKNTKTLKYKEKK